MGWGNPGVFLLRGDLETKIFFAKNVPEGGKKHTSK
jgi:hypothetical protein